MKGFRISRLLYHFHLSVFFSFFFLSIFACRFFSLSYFFIRWFYGTVAFCHLFMCQPEHAIRTLQICQFYLLLLRLSLHVRTHHYRNSAYSRQCGTHASNESERCVRAAACVLRVYVIILWIDHCPLLTRSLHRRGTHICARRHDDISFIFTRFFFIYIFIYTEIRFVHFYMAGIRLIRASFIRTD